MSRHTLRALGGALVFCLALAPFARAGESCHGPSAEQADDPHAHHRAMLEGEHGSDAAQEERTLQGLSIPSLPVLDQDGRELDFYRDLVAGKTVAMNFVFTTCTTICPPMGAHFGKLQKLLGERAGRDVHLISVSVDPTTDTPERLRAWRGKFGGGEGWTLVTGGKGEITRLLKALQVFTPDIRDHSPTVILGNEAAGEWTRAYGLAPPAQMVEILDRLRTPSQEGEA